MYGWSHHRNVGQRRPTVPAQLVCLLTSSSQCMDGVVGWSTCLNQQNQQIQKFKIKIKKIKA